MGRPKEYDVTGEDAFDVLMAANQEMALHSTPWRSLLAEVNGGVPLTNGQFGSVKAEARVFALTQGCAITVPRPGDGWLYRVAVEEGELYRSGRYHGRSARAHARSTIVYLTPLTRRMTAAGRATAVAVNARRIIRQWENVCTELDELLELLELEAS